MDHPHCRKCCPDCGPVPMAAEEAYRTWYVEPQLDFGKLMTMLIGAVFLGFVFACLVSTSFRNRWFGYDYYISNHPNQSFKHSRWEIWR